MSWIKSCLIFDVLLSLENKIILGNAHASHMPHYLFYCRPGVLSFHDCIIKGLRQQGEYAV